MKIKIINPVVGIPEEMTQTMKKSIEKYLRPGTIIEFEDVTAGFPSVESESQDIINGAEILKIIVRAQDEGWDGFFVNCFNDPAVLAAREVSKVPVLGPYEAPVLFASLLSERVAVITTDSYGVFSEARKARLHKTDNRIDKVLNVGLTVLELENEELLIEKLLECCIQLGEEEFGAAVLGCTGMNYVVDRVQEELDKREIKVRLIEPLRIGVTSLEYMIAQGYDNRIYGAAVDFNDLQR